MADMFSMGLHAINFILLVVLLVIYSSNFRHLKSKYTAGLIFFSAFLLLETVMALFFETTMVMYYSSSAASNANILQIIKAIGLAILLWVSWE